MQMTNWVKMLKGDMSGLKKKVKEEVKPTDDKIYRIQWANGKKTNLVDHDGAVRKVNEWMNRKNWDYIRVINEQTKKIQVIYEPKNVQNRGTMHIKKLNEEML